MFLFCSLQWQIISFILRPNNKGDEALRTLDPERLDLFVSTLAAAGTFGFFFAVVAYGWYLAFLAMSA